MMCADITAVSSMATRHILGELFASYEQRTQARVTLKCMGGVDAARHIRAGEPADVVVLASGVIKQLEAEEWIAKGSVVDFARSDIAVAVREGLPRPVIHDEASVKAAISQSRAICYSTGPSGDYLLKLCERWDMLQILTQRSVQAPPGTPVSAMLARGDADLGFQQFSELRRQPGIDVIGLLPPEIQFTTVFAAGIASASSSKGQARSLLEYLAGDEAIDVKNHHGMRPA